MGTSATNLKVITKPAVTRSYTTSYKFEDYWWVVLASLALVSLLCYIAYRLFKTRGE
jgi:hypothetical protein